MNHILRERPTNGLFQKFSCCSCKQRIVRIQQRIGPVCMRFIRLFVYRREFERRRSYLTTPLVLVTLLTSVVLSCDSPNCVTDILANGYRRITCLSLLLSFPSSILLNKKFQFFFLVFPIFRFSSFILQILLLERLSNIERDTHREIFGRVNFFHHTIVLSVGLCDFVLVALYIYIFVSRLERKNRTYNAFLFFTAQ